MRKRFVDELGQLKSDVVEMGNLSKEMLKESIDAIKTSNRVMAENVISQGKAIRDFDNKIERRCSKINCLIPTSCKGFKGHYIHFKDEYIPNKNRIILQRYFRRYR